MFLSKTLSHSAFQKNTLGISTSHLVYKNQGFYQFQNQ